MVELELLPGPRYQPYRPVVLSFMKACGDVARPGFDITEVGDANIEIMRDGQLLRTPSAISNQRMSVQFAWRSSSSEDGTAFAVRAACDSVAMVSVQDLHGEVEKALSVRDKSRGAKQLLFQCRAPGTASCRVQFGWERSRSESLQFTKACGGVRNDVAVMSSISDANGAHLPLLLQQGRMHSPEVVTLPADKDVATFNVSLLRSLLPGEQPLRLGHPDLRVSSDVLSASIVAPHLLQTGHLQLAAASDHAALAVATRCLAVGLSTVDVTIPLGEHGAAFEPLHLRVHKECMVPPVWQQEWAVSLAVFGSAFVLSILSLSVCASRLGGTLSKPGAS